MDLNPLVSIVIPLYNGSNYIEEALQSAFSQDYENIEIVVVNDGSTDDGAGREICMKYADRINYLEKPNGGCASALNYGIRASKGEYISWLSHDDLYDPNKVSHQVALLQKEGVVPGRTLISNRGRLIDGEGKTIPHPEMKRRQLLSPEQFFGHLLFKKCVNGCGLLIPKAAFEEGLWFDETMRFVLDWNLWLKMAASGYGVYLDDTVLVSNRVHGGQVTAKQKNLHKVEAERTVLEMIDFLQEKPAGYLLQLYYMACAAGRPGTDEMARLLLQQGIKPSGLKKAKLQLKSKMKRLAKKVYHAIR